MVYFTCNHCGESIKKPSVEKHYEQKCRRFPKNVSCMDCMKDFHGEEFKTHTKCISELEKYSGKDYVPKDSKNTGQKKQETWMDIVHSILDTKEYNLNPLVRGAFQKIQNLDNVPRKKAKFINFAANCLRMRKDLVEHVWVILEKELEKMKAAKAAEMASRKKEDPPKAQVAEEKSADKPKEPSIGDVTETMQVKKSKSKKRKADKEIQNTIEQDEETDILDMVKQESDKSVEPSKKKSKKSSSKTEVESNAEQEPTVSTTTPDEFQWSLVIQCTVKKYGNNVKLDKVKKKVEKMYKSRRSLPEFTEKQQAKFDKKFAKYLKKCNLKIEDNVVKIE